MFDKQTGQKDGPSRLVLGCMRLARLEVNEAEHLIKTAIEMGLNTFDHADIYGEGECERIFSKAAHFSNQEREKVYLQSKCGIRKGFYDLSQKHILDSVDGILKRLKTEYLDFLLLHRPDALAEPEEVAAAFDKLEQSGKVRNFGVSNHNSMQIELLSKYVKQKISVNQLQFSITNCTIVKSGINVNMENDASLDRDGNILDYCRLHDITIQPWSPLQFGFFEGVFLNHDKFPALNNKLEQLSDKYNVTSGAVAIAFILRHPANMHPVIGTTSKYHLEEIVQSMNFMLTREEWYQIYQAAGNLLP